MYEYDFHTYSVRRRRSNKKAIFSLFGIAAVVIFIFYFLLNNNDKSQMKENVLAVQEEKIDENSQLGILVKQALADSEGKYSVVVKHLTTGESYFLNAHEVYEAGSLYKLWVMAVVFQQIEGGILKEGDEFKADVEELNKKFRIATESAELSEGELDFTVASALIQMITISHNYAALSLTEKVRLANVKKFLEANGLRESKVGTDGSSPATTASDVALFLEKLAKDQLANPLSTEKMVDLLKAQRLNNKLPKYLPESALVAHKTGELGSFTHDAGIVYTPNGEYVIVVLSESNYPPGAEERIAEISRAVYEYFVR